jgi:nitroreductase
MQSESFSAEFHAISEVIRRRRTSKDYDGKPVSKELIEAILELAVWAPNHGLTEPWKFRVLLPLSIQKWIRFLRDELSEPELLALEKGFERISKAGAILFVTHLIHPNEIANRENYAATSAAIQNILLAATALHLQSYWSSSKMMTHPKTMEFLEVPEEEAFVGAIWLGHGEIPTPKPRKLAREKTIWIK